MTSFAGYTSQKTDMTGLKADDEGVGIEHFLVRRYTMIAFLVIAVAVVLRLFQLGETSLWIDEAVYANNSQGDFSSFLERTRNRNSSPFFLPYVYYYFGDVLRDPFMVRIPPFFFSVLAVAGLLILPRFGVSRSPALLAGAALAISPFQVQYAQEVREYSLSVFAAVLVLIGFAAAVHRPSTGSLLRFSAVLFVVPFLAYGPVLLSVAALFVFYWIQRYTRTYSFSALLIPAGAIVAGILFTYLLTARYQFEVAGAPYLARYYMPLDEGVFAMFGWIWDSLVSYLRFGLVHHWLAIAGFVLIAAQAFYAGPKLVRAPQEHSLLLLCLTLFAGSLLGGMLGIYPFGGIRQQLFATPLIALAATISLCALAPRLPARARTALLVCFSLALVISSWRALPSAYNEVQDISSPVRAHLAGVPDEQVYIYYGAIPATEFHFPDRNFVYGVKTRGDVAGMGAEIMEQAGTCEVWILFSHVHRNERNQILYWLSRQGYRRLEQHLYVGAALDRMTRCAEPTFGDEDNQLFATAGQDIHDGGGGFDFVDYSNSSVGVLVSLDGGASKGGDAEGDILYRFEGVIGSDYDDEFVARTVFGAYAEGRRGADTFYGGPGNDIFLGQEGDDRFSGRAGADRLFGGPGFDLAYYADSPGGVRVRLDGGANTGADAEGDELKDIEGVIGSNFDDVFGASAGITSYFEGRGGNDSFFGGPAADTLSGQDGNDVLLGRGGNDRLFGGAGDDRFIFDKGEGSDTIFDFEAGAGSNDVIEISGDGAAFDTLAEILEAATETSDGVLIDFGDGDMLLLMGVQIADLHRDDFVFE